jgi:hypothetical protein
MTHEELDQKISNRELTLIYWVILDLKAGKGLAEVHMATGRITQLDITDIPSNSPHCGGEL